MTTTRPPSSDPADIAKWEAEQERALQREREEIEFRDYMRSFAGRVDATLTHIKEGQEKHAIDDVRQFRQGRRRMRAIEKRLDALSGTVTQTANSSKYNWGVLFAWGTAAVGIIGLAATIWGMLR